jgi:hypothetical protein
MGAADAEGFEEAEEVIQRESRGYRPRRFACAQDQPEHDRVTDNMNRTRPDTPDKPPALPPQPPKPDDNALLVGNAVDELLRRIFGRLAAEPRPAPRPRGTVGAILAGGCRW